MSHTSIDSTYSYSVTAPLPDGAHSMQLAQSALRTAITALTGDRAPRVDAMVCVGNRICSVVTASAPIATNTRPRAILRCLTRGIEGRADSHIPPSNDIWPNQVTARRLRGTAALRKQIDICHFTPVLRGLVHHPEDWPMSTIRARPASQMLVA
ncbi:hypothetical protein ACEWPL_009475 [Roseovarius sp. S1116L3]|uniref:hypothetical protein n=1 Tax=Roseovarius roseus TaxID=3342636 RepID=UPI0037280282